MHARQVPLVSRKPIIRPLISRALTTDGHVEHINENNTFPYAADLLFRGSTLAEDDEHLIPIEYRLRITRNGQHIVTRSAKEITNVMQFNRIPRVYQIDVVRTSDEVKMANALNNWFSALFSKESRLGYYFAPIPNELYGVRDTPTETEYYADFTFDLQTALDIPGDEQLTHAALLKYLAHSPGEISIRLSRQHLKALLDQVVDFKREDYHCLPLWIKVKHVHSTLPVPVNCSLRTKLSPCSPIFKAIEASKKPNASLAEKAAAVDEATEHQMKQVSWTHASTVSSHSTQPLEYVVQQSQKGFVPEHASMMYMTNQTVVNHPDFSRWIAVDFEALEAEFRALVWYDNTREAQVPYYRIPCPSPASHIFDKMSFWFFIEHYPIINAWTRGRSSESFIAGVNEPMVDTGDSSNMYIKTPKVIVDRLILQRKRDFNKDAHLMYLDELNLTVRPADARDGATSSIWSGYASTQQTRARSGIVNDETLFAKFTVTITVAFEPYNIHRGGSEDIRDTETSPEATLAAAATATAAELSYNGAVSHVPPEFDTASSLARMHALYSTTGLSSMARGSSAAANPTVAIRAANGPSAHSLGSSITSPYYMASNVRINPSVVTKSLGLGL